MASLLQVTIRRLIGSAFRTVWSLVLLALAVGAGYFIGQRWGETQGEPNGMWFGVFGGFVVWAIFVRPGRRRRRRRRGRRFVDQQYDSGDGGGWFGGDDDGGDGGGDD